jgi:hypothetical protein
MRTPITRVPGSRPPRARYLRAAGFALAIACIFAASPLRAAEAHHGDERHSQGHPAPRQEYRHDDHRHGNGYGDRDYGSGYSYGGYGAPPVVYAPVAAPGINLFLPL